MGKIDFTMSRACLAMAAFAAVAPCPAMAQDPVFGGLVGKFDRTFEPLEFGDRSDPAQQPFLRDYAAVVVPFGDIAIGPAVNLRLGAGLEGYEDRIREIVSHLDFVRIAEPADLELTTLYEFPLTLVMFDPHLPEAAPQPPMDVELYSGWPRNFELGNLEADDFAARLEDRLRERANSKALIDLAVRSPSPFVRTCFMVDAAQPTVSGTCARGLLHGSDRAGESGAKAGFAPHILSVLNQSDKPKYVTVIAIDSENEMRLVSPIAQGRAEPLQPGYWRVDFLDQPISGGPYHLVTIGSDHPVTLDDLSLPTAQDGARVTCAPGSPAGTCLSPALASGAAADWSISASEMFEPPPIVAGLGGGRDALADMAPWAVQMYSTMPYTSAEIAQDGKLPEKDRKFLVARALQERDHVCGGTLIAEDVVLTAAHCVAKPPFTGAGAALVFKRRRIRVGTHRLGKGGATFAIDGVAVHASYVPGQTHDDLALVHIKSDRATRPVPISAIDRPSGPTGPGKVYTGENLTAFGLGVTGATEAGKNWVIDTGGRVNHNPDMLQYGLMEKVNWRTCRGKLGADLGTRMICAGPKGGERGWNNKTNVFTCVGDSGGPLVRDYRKQTYLIGVVSWSRGCGYLNFDSVFTEVSAYSGWIDKALEKLAANPRQVIKVAEP